ncbi:unnamed protein product [Urochloa humidicola]
MGNTRVIAAVYGPREVQHKGQQVNNKEALVRCEYKMAEFSTGDQRRKPKGDRRLTEISRHLTDNGGKHINTFNAKRLIYLFRFFKLMVEQDQHASTLQH